VHRETSRDDLDQFVGCAVHDGHLPGISEDDAEEVLPIARRHGRRRARNGQWELLRQKFRARARRTIGSNKRITFLVRRAVHRVHQLARSTLFDAAEEKMQADITIYIGRWDGERLRYADFEITGEALVRKVVTVQQVDLSGNFPRFLIDDEYTNTAVPGVGHVVDNQVGFSFSGTERDSIQYIYPYPPYDTSYAYTDESQVQVFYWDIGLRYVFKPKEDFTPYIGGGLGLHIFGSSKVNYSGSYYGDDEIISADQAMALHIAGGLYAFQSYDFRFNIEGKYTIAFTDAFHGSSNTNQQFGIMIGITKRIEKKEKDGCGGGGGCGNGGCL